MISQHTSLIQCHFQVAIRDASQSQTAYSTKIIEILTVLTLSGDTQCFKEVRYHTTVIDKEITRSQIMVEDQREFHRASREHIVQKGDSHEQPEAGQS